LHFWNPHPQKWSDTKFQGKTSIQSEIILKLAEILNGAEQFRKKETGTEYQYLRNCWELRAKFGTHALLMILSYCAKNHANLRGAGYISIFY